MNKHDRKYYLHLKISEYFKSLNKNEQLEKIEILKVYILNINNDCLMNDKWLNLLNTTKTIEKLFEIILEKNDKSELLRHTSYFGVVVPQELIIKWKNEWIFLQEKK